MKYQLLVRGRAKTDVRRAATWYERRSKNLGREFVAEVDAVLARIEVAPDHYQVLHRDIRRAIVHRFPYGVFYKIQGDEITVFAVVHLKRDDIAWKV